MARVAQHPPDEPHVRKLHETVSGTGVTPVRGRIATCGRDARATFAAFVKHVQRFQVKSELRRGVNALGDRRIKSVQTIQQKNLVRLQFDGFGSGAPAFLETVNRFVHRLSVEQRAEVLVQQLNVERLGRLVIPVVDPVGRMFDQRPEIIVEVQHQKSQALLFQPLCKLDGGGRFAG